jgi:hypothetical protein
MDREPRGRISNRRPDPAPAAGPAAYAEREQAGPFGWPRCDGLRYPRRGALAILHDVRVTTRALARTCAVAIAIALAAPQTAIASARKSAATRTTGPAAEPAPAPSSAAAPPPAATGESGSVDMAEVKKIYDEGKAKYDTLDYTGAIDSWTRAYAMVPAQDEYREARNDLAYNIATAQEKQFEIDKKVEHLRQARGLLVSFVDEYKKLYEPTPEAKAEVQRVKDRIAALDARILQAEQSAPPPAEIKSPKKGGAAVREVFRQDPELYQQYRSGRSMMIGGAVSLGIGGAMGLVAIALADRDQFPDARPLAISLGAVGLAAVVAGAVLLGIGVPKRKRALREAQSRVVVAPTFSRGFAGVGLVGRF